MWCGREGEEGCLCGVVGRGRRDAYVVWQGGGGGMPMWCGREGVEGCLCGVVGRGRRDAYVVW